ncbi:MAG: tetratricopeptide repeat protein, partial [Planctomycetota bacterium]
AAQSENFDDCNGDYFAARLDIANEEYAAAIVRLDRCLEIHPIFPYALALKSQANASLKNYDKAIDNAKKALAMNPLDQTIAKQYAILLYARSQRSNTTLSNEEFAEIKNALFRAFTLAPDDLQLATAYSSFIREDDPEAALLFLQKVQRNQPTVSYSLLLGSFALEESKNSGSEQRKAKLLAIAGSAYQVAIEIEPDNSNVLTAYSEFLRITGRREEAGAMFAGNDASLWKFHFRDGQYIKAKEILQKLYENNPDDIEVITGLSLIAQKTQDTGGLKKHSEHLLEIDPSDDNELFQIQLYLESGLTKEADLKLAGFRERNPEHPKAMLLMGNLQESLDLINRNLEIAPDSALAWRLRGQVNSFLGDFRQSEEDTKKSISISDDPSAHIALARIYIRADKKTKAIHELNSLRINGHAPAVVYVMLEQLYGLTGRKIRLKELYSEAIKEFPEEGIWYLQGGRFYLAEQDYVQAEKLCKKAWQLSQKAGGDADALNQYLQSMWLNGKYEEILEYASQYIETPFAAIAYAFMAHMEIELKNTPAAIVNYHKAIEKSAGNPSMQMEILQKISKNVGSEEVEKYCEQKLQSDPDSVVANLTMRNLSQQNGQYDKALGYIDKLLLKVEPDSPAWITFTSIRAETLLSASTNSLNEQYLEQAIEACEAILVRKPDSITILNNLAY